MTNTTSLKIPEELKERVATVAQGVAQTPHAYMVDAIAEKVARDERRQEFLASARESSLHFKRTGAAYAIEDVERYILARARGDKPPKPKSLKIPRSQR